MLEETKTAQEKELQIDIVYSIVSNSNEPLRTDQIKIAAMKKGVSCADKYLRMLCARDKVARFWEIDNKQKKINSTKQWSTMEYFNQNVKPKLNTSYVL